jgi:hypothetical protein
MNEDTIVPWLLQPQAIWMALAGGSVPGRHDTPQRSRKSSGGPTRWL